MGSQVAFVMEQTLGHVTHYENLRTAASRQTGVSPTWIPVAYETSWVERLVPGYGWNWSVRASYRARRRVSRLLDTRKVDALFFHTQVTALFSDALMRRVPTVISLDATPANFDTVGAAYGHRAATGTWLDRRKFAVNRDTFHAARALIAWSAWARDSLVADYGVPRERVTVIPPGASDEYFRIGERRSPRHEPNEPTRLLFVGGDFARKGGHLLLASSRAARTRRPFEIHIVTRDEVPSTPNVIVHHGLAPNSPELLRLFAQADIFVLPTYGDCLGVVLMEASAAGLPIITTNVGAMPEAAVSDRNAVVLPAGDETRLRAAIELLVDDESLRSRLGTAGREFALARFDANRNARQILAVIESVTDRSARASVA